VSDGDLVEVDVRGRRLAAEVVKPPFVRTSVK
jgi:aminomethyltransferase